MLSDAVIIARASDDIAVITTRHEILFKDCTAVTLHPVWQRGAPANSMRAVRINGQLAIIDLTKLTKNLAADIPASPTRDLPGLVFYSLRAAFSTAAEFNAAALVQTKCFAHPDEEMEATA